MKLLFPSLILLFCCSFAANAQSQDVALAQGEKMMQNHRAAFEENKGQVTGNDAAKVNFVYKDKALSVFLLKTGIAYQFNQTHYPEGYKHLDKFAQPEEREKMEALARNIRTETYRMDIELLGANTNPRITTEGKSQDYTQYYNHNALNVHNYSKITYHEVYPNIDWVIYKTDKALKYDFIVRKGGNPAQIQLKTHWVEDLQLNADGGITLKNRMGNITEQSPVSFQADKAISTQFKLENNVLSFAIANYDPNQTLIIDPTLIWATYYGGVQNDIGNACTADSLGNLYLAGNTKSLTNIASGGHQNTFNTVTDAFLVKFNSAGARQWATYYGGSDSDMAYACATDGAGNVYLSGETKSSNAIASAGHQNIFSANSLSDAFLVKFNSTGTRLWGTYYGSLNSDRGYFCAADAAGNVYLAGETNSSLMASGGHQNTAGGGYDAFLVKFNSVGTQLWATYYGDSGDDAGVSCVVDAANNIYLAGHTNSLNGINLNGQQSSFAGVDDAFLVKFNSAGQRQWGTYYGGASGDYATACVLDANDNIYLAGQTLSSTGISSNGFQNTSGGNTDAFLAKFSGTGALQWATYYGGTAYESAFSSATDASGNVYLVGQTFSSSAIASAGHQNNYAGNGDAFCAKFNSAGALQWATYYGGLQEDLAKSCAVDAAGNVYLAGQTESIADIAAGGHQNALSGGAGMDAFLAKFQGCASPTTATITQASCTNFTLNGTTYTSSGTYTQNRTNTAGCDSTITLNLTINQPTSATITQASCTSFTLNGTTYTASGTYTQNRTNTAGCDSTITLNFTRNQPTTATITQASCTNFTLNGTTYTSSGTYTQNRTNAAGCDSTITLNLTINQPTSATITQASCTNFTLNGTIYTSSGTYTQNRTNTAGCDSTITLNLTINQPTTATITQASCTNFTLNGTTYTSSGTYTQNRTNAAGCDSTITLNLTINVQPSVSITQSGTTLQATTGYVSYVWSLDGTIISGATNSSHTATANGDYQVTVTDANGCQNIATINYTASNIGEISSADFVKIFPNPSEGIVNINFSQSGAKTILIYDNLGRLIYQNSTEQIENQIYLHDLPSGVYQIQIIQSNAQMTKSLIIAK